MKPSSVGVAEGQEAGTAASLVLLFWEGGAGLGSNFAFGFMMERALTSRSTHPPEEGSPLYPSPLPRPSFALIAGAFHSAMIYN